MKCLSCRLTTRKTFKIYLHRIQILNRFTLHLVWFWVNKVYVYATLNDKSRLKSRLFANINSQCNEHVFKVIGYVTTTV